MLIIGQDRTYAVSFEKIEYIAIGEGKKEYAIITKTVSDNEIVLGAYKTEKRAMEILKEITERAEGWENLKMGQPSGICRFVYEMPKE